MNKSNNKILLTLGIASLIAIFFVVAGGTIKGKYKFFLNKGSGTFVLGVTSEKIKDNIQGVLELAKDEISKKAVDTEAKLQESLEKEVKNLTSAQIKSIKTKICQDWGVISTNSSTVSAH